MLQPLPQCPFTNISLPPSVYHFLFVLLCPKNTKKLKRLRKKVFLGLVYGIILILAVVRCAFPQVMDKRVVADVCLPADSCDVADVQDGEGACLTERSAGLCLAYDAPRFVDSEGRPIKNRIYSVPGFRKTFPDLQDVHIVAARRWGVSPVEDRKEAEKRKNELVYVGSNPYYTMDGRMNYSIPYLVPRASDLLQKISRNFLDSLAIKGIPLHTLIVTSVLRTENDIRRLRRVNYNASEESCHRFGTTFDISYHRYNTVSHPDGPERRAVRNDTLKWVLSEVLRDVRAAGLCYVKYEVKQGCYHVTVR